MAPWLLRLAALPPSLIALILGSCLPPGASPQTLDWPYNLSPDVKYYPEDEMMVRRELDIQQKLNRNPVTGVKKMSPDPGEKFWLDYWAFDDMNQGGDDQKEEQSNWSNWTDPTIASPLMAFSQPVRRHSQTSTSSPGRLLARFAGWHLFEKRGFQCPSGTSACTSIDRPDSCCATGATCQIVADSSTLGDVGCCPDGEVCADSLSTCAAGYTACPDNPGGGCCIPGYACYDVGCVQTASTTATATTTTTSSSSPTPRTTTVTSYTTITPSPSTTVSTKTTTLSTSSTTTSSTVTVAPLVSTITETVTVTSTPAALTCSSGYRSCAASLGGGCCPSSRECGSANCPASTTSTSATPAPPVRPTSFTTEETTVTTTAKASGDTTKPDSTSTSSSSSTTTTTSGVSGCPTGFYACSAYYQGGCCQTGRDCDTTSCPAGASTTLVATDSLTIVAPTGSGVTAPGDTVLTGACATGWATCSQAVGGGCCPSGYSCGTASCSPGATGGSGVGKEAPNRGARRNVSRGVLGLAGCWATLTTLGFVGL